MTVAFTRRITVGCTSCAVLAIAVDGASACSVCFGDPDSAMAKGAEAGVLVLAGVISFVLAGVAGASLFWLGRGRRLATLNQGTVGSADERDAPGSDVNGD